MYRVHLHEFEGPLDLLLFFIRRDELDVFDIPIARIADEYLAYVRVLEEVDLDTVGDFLYMAALLIHLKARMLLPQQEVDEDGEPVDPRRELVERLLEYIRFKEASKEMHERYAARGEQFTRGAAAAQEAAAASDEVLLDVSVFDLIGSLRRVLSEAPEEPLHAVRQEEYTVQEQQAFVLERVALGAISFVKLVRKHSKPFVIATFLAVLELARQGAIELRLLPEHSDFFLCPSPARVPEAEPAGAGPAEPR